MWKRARMLKLLRSGDVVVGDEGNIGRMIWDGNFLIVCLSNSLYLGVSAIFWPLCFIFQDLDYSYFQQVIFLNTCIPLLSPHHISIESFIQAQPIALMGATLLSISISVHGASKLRLISSFCRIECGQRRQLYFHVLVVSDFNWHFLS